MQNSKQLSINFITQILSFSINLAISFFLTPYVIKFIGKDVYGFVSLANNFTSYVTVLTVALNGMLSRYVTLAFAKKDYNSISRYMSSVFFANAGLMLIFLPISIIFVINLDAFINLPIGSEWDVKLLFLLIFISFCVNLPGGCFYSATYAANRLDKANISSLIGSILRIAVLLLMLVTLTPHVWYVGLTSMLCTLYLIVAYFHYQKRFIPEIRISIQKFHWGTVKELVGIGIWNSVSQLSQILLNGMDLIIANLMVNVMSMNLLSYAKMIPTQLLSLLAAIAGIFAPTMTIAYGRENKQDFVKETNFAIRCCGFLCSVPIIGLVVFGESFYSLWLQTLSVEEVHTVAILSVLTILPQIFSVYIYPLYSVNTITAKIKLPVIVTVGYSILNVILVYILLQITNLGIYLVAGVSSVLSLLYIFFFVPIYAAYTVAVPWTTFYKPLVRGMFCNGILIILFRIIKIVCTISNWTSFFMVCLLAAVIAYLMLFFVLFNKVERKKVSNMVRSKVGRKV